MRILFVGDVVGRAGRVLAVAEVPRLRRELAADFVILNGENVAGGVGITPQTAAELLEAADVVTLGNHAWAKQEAHGYLDMEPRLLRPANYPRRAPGVGQGRYRMGTTEVAVLVVQGRVFMDPAGDPFELADSWLEDAASATPLRFVEVHAEATSEKVALGRYLDGRVTAVVGTHTHVTTADEQILPGGTAYITDVGMTGPTDSVIGMRADIVLQRFTTGVSRRFEVADGPAHLSAVVIDAEDVSGRASAIRRIRVA